MVRMSLCRPIIETCWMCMKFELEFLEQGGYGRLRCESLRARLVFEDFPYLHELQLQCDIRACNRDGYPPNLRVGSGNDEASECYVCVRACNRCASLHGSRFAPHGLCVDPPLLCKCRQQWEGLPKRLRPFFLPFTSSSANPSGKVSFTRASQASQIGGRSLCLHVVTCEHPAEEPSCRVLPVLATTGEVGPRCMFRSTKPWPSLKRRMQT
jgi:hypothetical protein